MKKKIHLIMNKKIYIPLLALAGLLPGCVEDTGNYDYLPAAEVAPGAITGLEDAYTIVALDSLLIAPVIAGPEDAYTYEWQAYPVPAYYNSRARVIGEARNLAYQVALPAGNYEIVLEVKDKKLQTSAFARATLHVTLEFSQGWFIAKAVGGETDVDFIKLANGTVYPDILEAINGERPAGAPVANGYISTGYGYETTNPDGTPAILQNQPAFFVATDEDLRVYEAGSMTLLKTFDNAFFERPAVKQPRAFHVCESGMVVMNDGKLHAAWTLADNLGLFGYQVGAGDVELSPFSMRLGYGFLFFDNRSSSFRVLSTFSQELGELWDYSPYPPFCNNMDADLVYMHEKEEGGGQYAACALMKDRSYGDFYILYIDPWTALSGYNAIMDIFDVPATSELCDASLFAVHHTDDVIYYSRGDNKVGYFTVYNGLDTPDIITLPAGERVACIRHVYDDAFGSKCLAVLANGASGWKLYCYNFKGYTPDVQLPAFQSFSGEGEARSFLYRDVGIMSTN
jgi:hypothetical protein